MHSSRPEGPADVLTNGWSRVPICVSIAGVCMLLTILEEQAMDSLLLGPDKQNDFMQSILHVMEKQTDGAYY